MPSAELFGMPLGLANLVLALWLMIEGLKEPFAAPDPKTNRVKASWA
jgi:hypothetical protein